MGVHLQRLLTWEQGSRQQSRLNVHLPAILTTRDGTRRVLLQDVSTRGARFSSQEPLCTGQDVVVQWLRFEGFGKIRWQRDDVFGVTFARALAVGDLVETRDRSEFGMQAVERDIVSRTARAFVEGRLRL